MRYDVIIKKEKFPSMTDDKRIVFHSITKDKIGSKAYENQLKELGLSSDDIEIKPNFSFSKKELEEFIYRSYGKEQQSQDLMWTNYHRTNLVAQGVADVEAQVVGFVLDVEGGKKLSTALKNVNADQKPAFEKLVKIGLRTAWAKKCIDEGLSAMAEGREPNYPPFPSFEA